MFNDKIQLKNVHWLQLKLYLKYILIQERKHTKTVAAIVVEVLGLSVIFFP